MAYNSETGLYEGYIYKITNEVNDKIYIGQTTVTIADRWHGHMSAALNEKRNKSALYNVMRKYGREKFHIEQIEKFTATTKDALIKILNNKEQYYIKEFQSLIWENGYNLEKGGNNKKVPGRKVHKYDTDLNYICSYESCEEAGRKNNIDGCTVYACCKHEYFRAGGYVWCFDGETPIKPYYKPRKKKPKKPYVSKAMNPEIKRKRRLERLGWNGEKIVQYNSYGEVINVFDDLIVASQQLKTTPNEIRKNLDGKNLCFKKTVLRYESDSFDKFPRAKNLQPITLYDLQGKFVANFECVLDAEKYLNVASGEILKSLKRGGSCKSHLVARYGEPLKRKVYQWSKNVCMYDDKHKLIKEFENKHDISKYFNCSDCHHQLNAAIKNKTKYKGYFWEYKKEFALTA